MYIYSIYIYPKIWEISNWKSMIRRQKTRAAHLTTPPRFLLKHTKVQLEGHHCQPDVQTSNQPRILWASPFFPGQHHYTGKRNL